MPPLTKQEEVPAKLRPYIFHGMELSYKQGDKEATACCPYCGREGKFSINIQSGQWRCLVCQEGNDNDKGGGGNVYIFLRKLWEASFDATTTADYQALATERKLLEGETFLLWSLAKSVTTEHWLIPGYSTDGKLTGLYQYLNNGQRMMLMPTPTLGHHLFGMDLFDKQKPIINLCEGIWDPTSLWEVMSKVKRSEGKLMPTSNRGSSLLADTNVLGFPAAKCFYEPWTELFSGKIVNLLGHNDHERIHPRTGQAIESASWEGMRRIAKLLQEAPQPPVEINILTWGPNGYDPARKSGYDIRDLLNG